MIVLFSSFIFEFEFPIILNNEPWETEVNVVLH